MIRSFEVKLNAAHPELPLFEASAIVGSPSTAFIRRVPATVGTWTITKVYAQAEYPDGTITTVEAAKGAEGVWTATLPATQTSGRVRCGFTVLADGIDENDEPVTGYTLGIADMAVYTRDLVVQPGTTAVIMKYFDTAPTPAKKGDVAPIDGTIKMYDGTQWVSLGGASDYSELTNKPSINNVELSGNKTGAALGLLSLVGGTLTGGIDFTNKSYPFCINKLPAAYEANLANTPKLAEIASKGFIGWFPGNGSYLVMSQYDLNGWPDMAWSDGEHEYSILIENRNTDGSVVLEYYNGTELKVYHVPPYGGDIAMQYYIALAFSANKDYAQGAIVYKDGFIYRALVPHRGAWNASHFEITTIGDAIASAASEAEGKADPSLIGIPAFSTEATYTVGAKVVYSNAVWNCTTAVETAGSWTGTTNWTKLFDLATDAPASGGTSLITNGQVFAALAGFATKADATLTALQWGWSNVPTGVEVGQPVYDTGRGEWTVPAKIEGTSTTIFLDDSVPPTATTLEVPISAGGQIVTMVATKKAQVFYQLGDQADKPVASEAETDALRTAVATKAADNAVVKLTGDQTIAGVKTFTGTIAATNGILVEGVLEIKASQNIDDGLCYILKQDGKWAFVYSVDGTNYKRAYLPLDTDYIAGLNRIAAEFNTAVTYDYNALCCKDGVLYRCTNTAGHTGAWVAADFAAATVENVLAALRTGKADKVVPAAAGNIATLTATGGLADGGVDVATALRYALGATITASATLADRTNNRVVPAADNTTNIVLTFPAATAGKARDFLVLITNTTGNTGAISFKTPSGSSVYGDAFKTPIASGETWLYSFTEVANNEFFTRAQKMEDPYAPAYWGLYFEAEEAGAVVSMAKTGSPTAVTLETSTDGTTWTTFDAEGGTTPITLANEGDRVYFRAGTGGNTAFGSSSSSYHNFTLSKKCGAYGNIMSLLDGSNQNNVTIGTNYAFVRLFAACSNLTAAPLLPATSLANYSYSQMFSGCTSLEAAPQLPATTMSESCYSYMFDHCTALAAAPELPATTLAFSCYEGMFRYCSALVTPPLLSATTLAQYCFMRMFYGCSALTESPVLPDTTVYNCFAEMFRNCSSLAKITVGLTTWRGTDSWVYNVAANGTFYCPAALGTNETITRGTDYCPSGWTVVNV